MTNKYDLIVIGTGSAGQTAAFKAKEAGLSVAIADDRPFGGTCPNRGCDPKKVLTGVAEQLTKAKRFYGSGLDGIPDLNWGDLMAFKRKFTEGIPEGTEENFAEAGIHSYHGQAVFTSSHRMKVGDTEIEGAKFFIAAGARPAPLDIPGEEFFTYSDDFLELKRLPETIIFVGGGYISFEFAHLAARAGARVHLLHSSDEPLKAFDRDLVDTLIEATEKLGVQVHLNTEVKEIAEENGTYIVKASQNGENKYIKSDLVVHGAGRVPNIGCLDLNKAGINHSEAGVEVNEHLQSTSRDDVYAAGDAAATSGPPLTPVAGIESDAAISNLLENKNKTPVYTGIPSVVFTLPKLAMAGVTEQEAVKQHLNYKVSYQDISGWFTYKKENQEFAESKILIDPDSGKIIGAHLISDQADELINIFSLAIQLGLKPEELSNKVFAYPTAGSDLPSMFDF